MNLARKTFGMMSAGYRKKKLRKYYDSLAEQTTKTEVKTSSGETIPITIQPIVKPIDYPFPQRQQRPIQIIQQPVQQTPAQAPVQAPIQQPVQQAPAQPVQTQVKQESQKPEGYKIPDIGSKTEMATVRLEGGAVKPIVYPLIPEKPKKGEPILAYAKIHWEQKYGSYIY